jgi:hypothetical protein
MKPAAGESGTETVSAIAFGVPCWASGTSELRHAVVAYQAEAKCCPDDGIR